MTFRRLYVTHHHDSEIQDVPVFKKDTIELKSGYQI